MRQSVTVMHVNSLAWFQQYKTAYIYCGWVLRFKLYHGIVLKFMSSGDYLRVSYLIACKIQDFEIALR